MALWQALPVRLKRLSYRVAHALLRAYWFVVRPSITGVKCVLTSEEHILLVRHTYGRRSWDLPGGAVKLREPPAGAATREMREELGVTIERWDALGAIHGRAERRRDTLHCFRAELGPDQTARVVLDPVEIAAARWFPRAELPSDLGTYVRPVLRLIAG